LTWKRSTAVRVTVDAEDSGDEEIIALMAASEM
jgi:hypothetical protein